MWLMLILLISAHWIVKNVQELPVFEKIWPPVILRESDRPLVNFWANNHHVSWKCLRSVLTEAPNFCRISTEVRRINSEYKYCNWHLSARERCLFSFPPPSPFLPFYLSLYTFPYFEYTYLGCIVAGFQAKKKLKRENLFIN